MRHGAEKSSSPMPHSIWQLVTFDPSVITAVQKSGTTSFLPPHLKRECPSTLFMARTTTTGLYAGLANFPLP